MTKRYVRRADRHLSLAMIAKRLGITKTRVQQLEARALDKLKRSPILQAVAREMGISDIAEVNQMPTKKANAPKTKAEKKTRSQPKAPRLSALNAAAQVLRKAGRPMNCKELIETMAAKRLWTSPRGKTPHSTLWAAMTREITTKGAEARFRKAADRGKFESAGAA